MNNKILFEQLTKSALELGYKLEDFCLEKPSNFNNGDLATNLALVLAKPLKRNPLEVAEMLVKRFPENPFIEKIEIRKPGFINFFFKKDSLVKNLDKIISDKDSYGKDNLGQKKKVVLEHTNVNPNKALHIGHLRNACLGNSCEKILEYLGYDVEAQYYVDDTGVQVAVTYLGTKKLSLTAKPDQKFDHYAQDIYVKTMEMIENDPEYKMEQMDIIEQLDSQSGKDIQLVKELATKVIYSNLETMNNLKIDYDLLVWESDIITNGFWQKAFEVLKKNNKAFVKSASGKNKGCWVIKNVLGDDKVIVKSNGVTTYTGKDISYHFWKFNLLEKNFLYKPWSNKIQQKPLFTTSENGEKSDHFGCADMVVNFIDVRQTFPQQAVKESLQVLGYKKEAENLKHVGYGVVFLSLKTAKVLGIDTSDNKNKYAMSGRKGTGILADDLFDLVYSKAKELYPDSKVVHEVTISAIKYYMLKYNTLRDIIFDLDQALDFHGNSGPYLQYTYARAQSILRKANSFGKDIKTNLKYQETSDEEKELIVKLLSFGSVIKEAGENFAPNLLCNYLFELCQGFNTYYAKNIVVSAKEESSQDDFRILLTVAVGQVLNNGLTLLGIPAPEQM